MDWERQFRELDAFWFHDGNPKRPYARLTSGKISNGFFNGGIVARHAKVFGEACETLSRRHRPPTQRGIKIYVVGAAMGAIALASRIAEALDFLTEFAEKENGELVFKRAAFEPRSRFVLVEDTITAGGTILKLETAVKRSCPDATVTPWILALCNRSGNHRIREELKISALINRPMQTWDEGHNPFTSDGKELVEPVRPKGNWDALTRAYD